EDLPETIAPSRSRPGASQPGKCLSASLRHQQTEQAFGTVDLLWAVSFARGGGKVHERLARFVQDPPLHLRTPSRSGLSRMCLFGNEDVPGAVLQRLQRRGVRRRSGARAGIL